MSLLEPYHQTYTYDLGNNLINLTHQANSAPWQQTITIHSNNNRGTETKPFATDFDANGNLLTLNNIATLDWHYNNKLNKLNKKDKTTEYYVYDYQGKRVRTVLEVNQQTQNQRDYLPSLDISSNQNTLHITAHILAETSKNSIQTRYQLSSHLQSNTLEINDKAQTLSYEHYYPYGGTALIAGTNQTQVRQKRYRYTGKERDDSSGLSYYGARYLAPWMARWVSPDSARAVDGLNLYVYVGNNPLKYLDPTGHIQTISWAHFVDITNKHMQDKPLNFWVGEYHDEPYGFKLLSNLSNSIKSVQNFVSEGVDVDENETPAITFGTLDNFYDEMRSDRTISHSMVLNFKNLLNKNHYYIGRGRWHDPEDEYYNNLQTEQKLQGNSFFLVGAHHLLADKRGCAVHGKKAYPVYKYIEPKTSIALAPRRALNDYKYFDQYRPATQTQEFGLWVRGEDGSTENASLVFGEKSVMQNLFGNLAELIPIKLQTLPGPTAEQSPSTRTLGQSAMPLLNIATKTTHF